MCIESLTIIKKVTFCLKFMYNLITQSRYFVFSKVILGVTDDKNR
jgi:hypothetical protein